MVRKYLKFWVGKIFWVHKMGTRKFWGQKKFGGAVLKTPSILLTHTLQHLADTSKTLRRHIANTFIHPSRDLQDTPKTLSRIKILF